MLVILVIILICLTIFGVVSALVSDRTNDHLDQ
jgi:hypothetical protein